MVWALRFERGVKKFLPKLGQEIHALVLKYMQKNLQRTNDPRAFGKRLSGKQCHLWRYRVGKIRVIAEIKDSELVVLVVKVGYRGDVYKR